MNLLDAQTRAIKDAEYHAAAFGTEIHGNARDPTPTPNIRTPTHCHVTTG
jgi:hypothetical protein